MIPHQQIPMTVHYDRSIGQMSIEDELQHASHVSHLVRRQGCFAKDLGETGSFQQAIALAKGQVEHFAQSKHGLTPGLAPARSHKTATPPPQPPPPPPL